METNQLMLAYPEGGNSVRTLQIEDDILFCLIDVVELLSKQNVDLARGRKPDGVAGLISAQLDFLDPDEVEWHEDVQYVTQSGLFRIVLRDNSAASKKFQRWVLHDVLPSIQKYGTYPPPLVEHESDVKKIVKSLLLEIADSTC